MILQNWITDCLQMFKISDEVINLIEETIKRNWRVNLTVGGKSSTEVKIQRGIFRGDVLSPFLLVIAMMSLNHIRRKCIGEYKLHKSKEKKINHLMYIDDINLFVKNGKELNTKYRQ